MIFRNSCAITVGDAAQNVRMIETLESVLQTLGARHEERPGR